MTEEQKEDSYKKLLDRVQELRMQYLFEEPCPLYEEDDDHDGIY